MPDSRLTDAALGGRNPAADPGLRGLIRAAIGASGAPGTSGASGASGTSGTSGVTAGTPDTPVAAIPGGSPVAAFIALHPTLTAFLAQRAPAATSIVHLSQELRFPGDPSGEPREDPARYAGLAADCTLLAARPAPGGTTVDIRAALRDAEGEAVVDSLSGVFLGGIEPSALGPLTGASPAPKTRAPAPAGDPLLERVVPVTPPFIEGYARASGDDNAIHLDPEAARAAGFGSTIAHGMSLVAIAAELAAEALDLDRVDRIRSLGVRFSAGVEAGSEVEFSIAPSALPGVLAVRAQGPGGPALKSGWISLNPEGPS